MNHLEYNILKLYEHRKQNSDIKVGIDRFSPRKKTLVIIFLAAMLLSAIVMAILLLRSPNNLMFLWGLIPCIILMVILVIMDERDSKLHIEQHIQEYNKRIDLFHKMLVDDFSINSKEKVSAVITMFQKYLDEQGKQDKKTEKIAVTVITSISGIITTTLANLDSIGMEFNEWLNIAALILTAISMTSIIIYIVFYCISNLNAKKDRYESVVNDLQYLQLSKYQ